ncbi:MAG: GNAT family N-acetyltransferase [Saprospiraceae bacterium]
MIQKLQHSDIEVAEQIRAVFQVSYAVEAELLGATDFPPLKRPLEEYVNSRTVFFGYYEQQELAAVTEITHNEEYTHINSLVVDPKHFRKGIATKLIDFTFNTFDSALFIVETGAKNKPAITLYEKHGFAEVKRWVMPGYGITKVRFELIRTVRPSR